MKTYKIESIHEVSIDSFTEGELDHANSYTREETIKADSLKEAVAEYFEDVLCYRFDFNIAHIDEQGALHYDVLVNAENSEITKEDSEYEAWKEGKETLYTNNIYVMASIVTPLNFNDLKD